MLSLTTVFSVTTLPLFCHILSYFQTQPSPPTLPISFFLLSFVIFFLNSLSSASLCSAIPRLLFPAVTSSLLSPPHLLLLLMLHFIILSPFNPSSSAFLHSFSFPCLPRTLLLQSSFLIWLSLYPVFVTSTFLCFLFPSLYFWFSLHATTILYSARLPPSPWLTWILTDM